MFAARRVAPSGKTLEVSLFAFGVFVRPSMGECGPRRPSEIHTPPAGTAARPQQNNSVIRSARRFAARRPLDFIHLV